MKTINASVRPNGQFAHLLDYRSIAEIDTSSIKRQSRRQVRHRERSELRLQMDEHFAEAKLIAIDKRREIEAAKAPVQTATIIQFPADARRLTPVLVVRKLRKDPFQRQQKVVSLLAA